jgi:hypothetical protein
MPIFLEPDQKFPIVLASDKDKPAESRPTFFAKSQSMRGQRRIATVLDRLTEDKEVTADQLFTDAVEVLATVLTGWQNMNGIAYSKEALEDVLSYSEARELLRGVAYNQHVTVEEKKSSE